MLRETRWFGEEVPQEKVPCKHHGPERKNFQGELNTINLNYVWTRWRREYLLNLGEFHRQPLKGSLARKDSFVKIGEEVVGGWILQRNLSKEKMAGVMLLKLNSPMETGFNVLCSCFCLTIKRRNPKTRQVI